MKLAVFVSLLVIIPFQAEALSCVGKNVNVLLVNGHDLTGDGLMNPDPYVVVTIGIETKKSKVIEGDANPVWYEKLTFQRVTSGLMKIEIWDSDEGMRGDDDDLGTCVEPLAAGGFKTIECKAKDSGYVKLIYQCV